MTASIRTARPAPPRSRPQRPVDADAGSSRRRPHARPHPARRRRLRARLSASIIGRLVMFGLAPVRRRPPAADAERRARHRPARPRRPQRRDPRHRHQDGLALRRAAQHHRSRRGDRADRQRPARSRCRAASARSSPPMPASSGSSARSRPKQQSQIHALGIPGIGFLTENRRFYPGGPTAAHIVGLVNIDNQGIAGIEKYIDDHGLADLHAAGFARGEDLEPVKLSIDLRVQHILRDELVRRDGPLPGDRRRPASSSTSTPARCWRWPRCRTTIPNNPVDALKPDRLNRMTRRRLRARLDLQELHLRHGARFRQGDA